MTSTHDPAAAPLLFNPFDPAFRADPYAFYRRLREEQPVSESPLGFLLLSRYADCVTMLKHPSSSNDFRNSPAFAEEIAKQGLDADQVMLQTRPFLFMDPPDHTRLRGLVSKAFTPRVVEELRPRIERLVNGLIDEAAARGSLEVIDDLAYPLPVTVICEMLGVPAEDHEQFRAWSREMARGLDPETVIPPDMLEKRQRAVEQFELFFRRLIEQRRAEPRDDLISALIAAEEAGSKLTENELVATLILLLIAGHETTVNLIGNGMLALLRNPDQLALLRDDPSLIKTAVEELLRYDPPVQLTSRLALEDIELQDRVMPKGQNPVLLIGSANRDPAQFNDPERLDITREDNRHIAFGMGIHFCLGAPLARVEGQIALLALVQRVEGAALAVDQPEYKENITLRGLASLPVHFDRIT
ncbi:MAG TPA: cytochrome P450 [Dehalococcoidia bacterium]